MENEKGSKTNEMTDAAFFMKVLFRLFFLLFYILMPVLLKSFHEWRTVLLLLASVLFILYCALRYYIVLLYFWDSKSAFRRQLLENGSILFGLIFSIALKDFCMHI